MGAALDLDAYELLAATSAVEEPARIEAVPDVVWSPHEPFEKQRQFMECPEFEAMYGGAAGGGKSDAMLMDALQDVNVPNFSALIIRKTYKDLAQPGGLMDRSLEWLSGTAARWNGTEKTWTFPSGATIAFGYMPNLASRLQYQGGEYQAVYFDELTQLLERCYTYMFSRIRRTHGCLDVVRTRVRSGTNPGGPGHKWVQKRFGITTDGVQVEKDAWDEALGEIRRFFPAGLKDNPYLDTRDYERRLTGLDEEAKLHLLHGLWVLGTAGKVLPLTADNLVARMPPGDFRHVCSIDLGSSEFVKSLAIAIIAWSDTIPDLVWIRHVEKHHAMLNSELATRIIELREEFGGFEKIIADLDALGVQFQREIRRRHFLPLGRAEKAGRIGYSRLFHDAAKEGDLLLVDEDTRELQNEADTLLWNEDRNKMMGECHAFDAAMYGYREARAYISQNPDEPPPPVGTRERDTHDAEHHKRLLSAAIEREKNRKYWKRT